MEVDINPDLLTVMLLYSFPPCYENFRCAIESREFPSPEVLHVKIVKEHDPRKNDTHVTGQAMTAKRFGATTAKRFEKRVNIKEKKGSATSQKKIFKFKCHSCGRIGHKASDCRIRTGDNRASSKDLERGKMADSEDSCVFACTPR